MADEEHLKKLLSGVPAWNEWRAANHTVIPFLRNAVLVGANLKRADLYGADLCEVNLSGANLTRANLSEANLNSADLSGANLSRVQLSFVDLIDTKLKTADLSNAVLVDSRLTGADLSQANLSGSDLNGSDLSDADLSQANLNDTVLIGAHFKHTIFSLTNMTNSQMHATSFAGVSLAGIIGLGFVRHYGPSYVTIDTLEQTAADLGKDPSKQYDVELFLEKAGVSKDYIEFFRSHIGQPIQFYSCFISYSTKDQAFADRLYTDLRQNDIRCWLATEDLKIGDKFRARINDAIRLHDKLLVVLSEESVKSSWVEEEVEAAFERERRDRATVLFPIRVDDAVMDSDAAWAASIRRTRHIGDFLKWKDHDEYSKSLERLIRDLRAENVKQKALWRQS